MTGWVTQIVEADGTPVGEPLDTLPGGSVTLSLPSGASQSPHRLTLTCRGSLPDMRGRFLVDRWMGDKTAAWWWVLAPEAQWSLSETGGTRQLSGVDMTRLLSRVKLPRPELMTAGTDVADWAGQMLKKYLPLHASGFRASDVDASVRSEMAFQPGDDLHRVTGEPLIAAGMTPWTPRPGGIVQSDPWKPAAERAVVATFGDETAPDSLGFLPDWTLDTEDAAPRANEVLAIVRPQSGQPEIVGRWANDASIFRYGTVTEIVPGTVEAVDQAAADTIARRWAEEHIRPRRTVEFSGQFHPIQPGQLARVVWQRWGIDGIFELVTRTTERTLTALTKYQLREV